MFERGSILSGRYQLLGLIGAGGFGSVYRARDRKTKSTVAIKVLSEQLSRDSAYLKRFHREGLIARALRSPHIVKVLSSGQDGETHYIVMELVEGMTLRDILRREGVLSSSDSVAIAVDLASAVAEAHSHGILHRDIKPENVFITPAGVKLGDFGIATADALGAATATYQQLGTAAYSSPEQVRGQEQDARSDVYSLGVVLYEMLEGQPPFTGPVLGVMDAHLHEAPPIRSELGLLAAILTKCLAKSPDERYDDAEGLLLALQGGDSGATDPGRQTAPMDVRRRTSPTAPAPVPASGRGRRRLTLLGLGGAAVIVLAAGAAIAAVQLRGGDDSRDTLISAELPSVQASLSPTAAAAALSPEGADCAAALPADAGAFSLPAADPERSLVMALNCANAVWAAAIDTGSTELLASATAGEALARWQDEIQQLHGRGDRVLPSAVRVVSMSITGDSAEVLTSEDWTLISATGSRSTCTYDQTYLLSLTSGRWLIESNDITGQPGC